ncbi:nitrilase-related carbon-nitrogen hydrolase [Cognataquiflexum rubidum]|uniref:nitrilase-related carbon-nitrogen hydrolase n=1 Tax=Cognataquiflexum rubidum TaxID=2922273 RepID=UPI001F131C2C|nr:nitrilase-related carbon-nitrogen hydrolase [Cognataquiflexum rubidum]MCH6235489.1 carbon-nitrogen hydrolase [Cognataquiflexum rubidum]
MKKILLVISVFVLIWAIWANTGFHPELPAITPEISVTENISPISSDSIRGNVVGIQPYMLETDYLTQQQFQDKLESYFKAANDQGFFRENTMVLLPEYLGTWLVIAEEKKSVVNAGNLTWAMAQLVLSHPFRFSTYFGKSEKESDRIAAALFRMKAEKMANIYQNVFNHLSKKYQVYIAAGSILLPGPEIKNGILEVDIEAPIYNTSFVFTPKGDLIPQSIRKAFPIESEHPFVTASPTSDIPTFDLPFGKIGVLVCADSWYPESYKAIHGVEVVLVNSYCAVDGAMDVPWAGYNGAPMPSDVDPNDIGKLTEKEAWMKYALPGRIRSSGAKIGANVFLRGQLWDLGTDGQPFFIRGGKLLETKKAEKGGIWNMDF